MTIIPMAIIQMLTNQCMRLNSAIRVHLAEEGYEITCIRLTKHLEKSSPKLYLRVCHSLYHENITFSLRDKCKGRWKYIEAVILNGLISY